MPDNPYAPPSSASQRAFAGQFDGPDREWTIGEMISQSWERVKRDATLVGASLLTLLIWFVLQWTTRAALGVDPLDFGPMRLVHTLINVVPQAWLGIGLCRMAIASARNQPVAFETLWSGTDRLGTAIAVNVLVGLCVFLGTMLLVIPGIVIALGWLLAFAFVADTRLPAIECLTASWQVTQGHRWHVLGLLLVLGLLVAVSAIPCGLGLVATVPMAVVVLAQLYVRLAGTSSSGPPT